MTDYITDSLDSEKKSVSTGVLEYWSNVYSRAVVSSVVFWPNPAREPVMQLKVPAPPQRHHSQSVPACSVLSLVGELSRATSYSPVTSETTAHSHWQSHYSAVDIRKTDRAVIIARCEDVIFGIVFWPLPNLVNRKSICCPVRLDTWSNSCENFPNLENEFCYEQPGKINQNIIRPGLAWSWSSSNLPIEWTSVQARQAGVGCGKNTFEI